MTKLKGDNLMASKKTVNFYLVNLHITELDGYGDMVYRTVVKSSKPASQVKIDVVLDTYYSGSDGVDDIVMSLKDEGEVVVSMGEYTDAVIVPKIKKITEIEYKILKKFLK